MSYFYDGLKYIKNYYIIVGVVLILVAVLLYVFSDKMFSEFAKEITFIKKVIMCFMAVIPLLIIIYESVYVFPDFRESNIIVEKLVFEKEERDVTMLFSWQCKFDKEKGDDIYLSYDSFTYEKFMSNNTFEKNKSYQIAYTKNTKAIIGVS